MTRPREEQQIGLPPQSPDLCLRYLDEHVKPRNAASTRVRVTYLVERQIRPAFGSRLVSEVTRADVMRFHDARRATPRQANLVLATLSKMFTLAELWGWRAEHTNPVRLVTRYPEARRDRVLNSEELRRLGCALDAAISQGRASKANAIALLALSGCRLSEVLSLTWDAVDLQNNVLRLAASKTGPRAHQLGEVASELLRNVARKPDVSLVFSSTSGRALSVSVMEKFWRRLCASANVTECRIHDLRHTVGTLAAASGANAFLVRDKLGHKTLAMTNRYVSRQPLRALSNSVEHQVAAAMGSSSVLAAQTQTGEKGTSAAFGEADKSTT